MGATKRRRADGTLRPCKRRYNAKHVAYMKHRALFEATTDPGNRIWNGEDLQKRLGGIKYAASGARLETMADVVGWIVFKDGRGKVHAIGKPIG